MTADPAGNLFVGTRGLIRRIDAASGTITTLAGRPTDPNGYDPCCEGCAGPPECASAWDLVRDPAGRLVFAELGRRRVRRLTPTCGNGQLDEGEGCDDGNNDSGDGCDANCTPTGCGNSIRTAGEDCDDGSTGGHCCSATCRVEVAGAVCSDDNLCTRTSACDSEGQCVGGDRVACVDPGRCGDAYCDPMTGRCVVVPVECDDGDPCTADRCDAATGCTATPYERASWVTCGCPAEIVAECAGAALPPALGRTLTRGCTLAARAGTSGGDGRRARKFLRAAARKLRRVANRAAVAERRRRISPPCAGALVRWSEGEEREIAERCL